MQVTIIGWVHSPLTERKACPKRDLETMPPVWIELDPAFADAAANLQVGDEILVLTWLHQGDRSVLRCHPMGRTDRPARGVFSTRSPDRPTPIGLHPARILERQGLRLQVHPVEVIDGTPVIDIKPARLQAPDADAAARGLT